MRSFPWRTRLVLDVRHWIEQSDETRFRFVPSTNLKMGHADALSHPTKNQGFSDVGTLR